MSILRSHGKLSVCIQLAIISLIYTRELLLLLGLMSLATPVYYGAIALMMLWNLERLLVKGTKAWIHLVFWGLLLLLSANLVTKSWRSMDTLITTAGRIITVLFFLNILRDTLKGDLRILRLNTYWNILFAFALALMCLSDYSYNDKHQLVYGNGNPNITAISAYICLLNLVVGLYAVRPNGERLLTCLAILLSLGVCLLSRGRTSWLSIGAFAVMAPLLYKLRNRKWGKVLVVLLALVPVLFPPLWILFYKLVGDPSWELFGKVVFSYRELIWDYMYGVLMQNPLASHLGQAVEHGSGPHNVPLAVWWDYGAVAFVLFNGAWVVFLAKLRDKMRCSADCVIVAAILSATVCMTFEVLLFSGGMNFSFRLFYLTAFLNLIRDGAARMKDLFSLQSLKREAVSVCKGFLGLGRRFAMGYMPKE